MKKIFENLTHPRVLTSTMLLVVVVLIMMNLQQCYSSNDLKKQHKKEVTRLKNNQLALQDTIVNYKDENGMMKASIRGYELNLDELAEDLEFEKSKPPKTVVEYRTIVQEKIVEVPTTIVKNDTVTIIDGVQYDSSIVINADTTFESSSRSVTVTTPFRLDSNGIDFASSTIDLEQNIWLKASVLQDRKTREVWVDLETDYPGITFNDAKGVLVMEDENLRKFRMQNRKNLGFGVNVGAFYDPFSNKFVPGIGIGLNFSPRWLQF